MPTIDLCDNRHQAIAFIGTCPICRRPYSGSGPLAEGAMTFRPDLDRALREHYATQDTSSDAALRRIGETGRP